MSSKHNKFTAAVCAAVGLMLFSGCTPEAVPIDLVRSENARQCIIDYESRNSGVYTAEHGGTPVGSSSASGAYQYLNGAWQLILPRAEKYYGLHLTSPEEEKVKDKYGNTARTHAAYASPYAQDVVTAFALLHKELNQNLRPWTGNDRPCYGLLGQPPQYRTDTPANTPPAYIKAQIDAYMQQKP